MTFQAMRFKEQWGDPCPLCIESDIRSECVRPLITFEAVNPLSRYGKGPICHDCAIAENMVTSSMLTFSMARTAVANDRQEVMRIPGFPTATRIVAGVGELDAIYEWMKVQGIDDE